MKITIFKDSIQFSSYPFSVASVAKDKILNACDIAEIHTENRFPPEIITKKGEVLFVHYAEKTNLNLFAKINNIPDTRKLDVWSYILEPYLDTEFSEDDNKNALTQLKTCGFKEEEITDIRDTVKKRILFLNSFLWEWTHLGHDDVLRAFGFGSKVKSLFCKQQEKYDLFNQISLRAIPLDTPEIDNITKVESLISTLSFEIFKDIEAESEQRQIFCEAFQKTIIKHYNETHRNYHNLDHVLQVASFCENVGIEPDNKTALKLAAWFHDIIYVPKKSDNEELSAKALDDFLTKYTNIYPDIATKAQELILSTKNHLSATDNVSKILSDADLFIFAQHSDDYDIYAKSIRTENHETDDKTYYTNRLNFLRHLDDHIKSTGKLYNFMHPMHEDMAKENIHREIDSILNL